MPKMTDCFVVAGSSGQLGWTLVQSILVEYQDARVIALDINDVSEEDKRLVPIRELHRIDFYNLDFSIRESVSDAINFILNSGFRIRGLINCLTGIEQGSRITVSSVPRHLQEIGITQRSWDLISGFSQYSVNQFQSNVYINLIAIHDLIAGLATSMVTKEPTSIINLASQYGLRPPDQSILEGIIPETYKPPGYSVSKAALISYTEYLAHIFKGTNVRANSISPGAVRQNHSENFIAEYSKLTLSNRMMEKHELVPAVLFLLSDDSQYINASNLVIDGGWSKC